ncbi:MAG TPA: hypothetical protein VFQ65_14510 [Kofleriaceae bacterium]|nr:hypothetical protein [Kofleriaceae bacterium]
MRRAELPTARVRAASTARAIASAALGTADPLNPIAIMLVEAVLSGLVAILQHLPSSRAAPNNAMWIVAGAWLALAVSVAVVRLAGAVALGTRRRHVEKDGDLFTAVLLIAALFAVSMAAGAL